MKNLLFAVVLMISAAISGQSQDFNRMSNLEIKTREDAKSAEDDALDAAKYILSTPLAESAERKVSLRLIIMWMTATTYQFDIDPTVTDLSKKNEDVLGLLMASMTKTVLETPSIATQRSEVKLQSYKTLLDYCGDTSNNVKQTKELKKAIEANKEGKLKEYLKL